MWTLFLIFVFLLAYYYFVLRRYNTLGFRIFSVCLFVSIAILSWWVSDWRKLNQMAQNGTIVEAIVWEKKAIGGSTQVHVMYHGPDYSLEVARCNDGLSEAELAEMEPQQTIQIRYIPKHPEVYLEKSYQRQMRDMPWLLLFPAFFLVLGSAAWYFLRQNRVSPPTAN